MKLRNFLIFVYVLAIYSVPGRTFAQAINANDFCRFDFSLGGQNGAGGSANPATCVDPRTGLTLALDNLINRLPFYLTGLAFLAFLYSGGIYIFALGDANKQEAAKKNLLWTATGMVVMASIGAVIRFAGWLSTQGGAALTNTNIPGLTQ
jgi:prepilin signal peptidase PulO-like enzyme (type II secretory pathway)